MKIRRKVFLLMLICVGVSFTVSGLIINYTRSAIHKDISDVNNDFEKFITTETRMVLEQQIKKSIAALTVARAEQIDDEIDDVQEITEMLSKEMTRLISNLYHYQPESILYPAGMTTYSGEPYVLYSPEIVDYRSYDLEQEISRVANIKNDLQDIAYNIAPSKNSCYIASEKGYFICVDYRPPSDIQEDTWDKNLNIDIRQRPWYQNAKSVGKLAFSKVFLDTNNELSISCTAPYYDGDNFAGIVGIGVNVSSWYKDVVKVIHSEGNTCFILNERGDLIFSSYKEGILALTAQNKNLLEIPDEKIAELAKKMVQGESGIEPINFSNEEYYLSFAPMPTLNWSLAVLTSRQAVVDNTNAAYAHFANYLQNSRERFEQIFKDMNIISLALFGVVIFILAILSNRLAKKFVKPLDDLAEGVKEISGGNLDKKIEVNTQDEISDLANSFNLMTDNLKTYVQNLTKVTAEKQKISTELNVAKDIQLSSLPHDFLEHYTAFEIFATMHAAKSVGGDFYDFYLLDENHLMITIADVSGKGVPAALFMMRGKTILKNFAMTMSSPDDLAAVMTLANNQLCQGNDEMMFITVFMALLDTKTGNLIYVNGGHNPPLVYNSQEKIFSYLSVKENCVLGMMEEIDFEQQEITLNHGDIIYLYTDGVTEAMDENNNQYGEKRLENFLNKIDVQISLEEILKEVHKDLSVHVGAAEQSDDITMLAVRFN